MKRGEVAAPGDPSRQFLLAFGGLGQLLFLKYLRVLSIQDFLFFSQRGDDENTRDVSPFLSASFATVLLFSTCKM